MSKNKGSAEWKQLKKEYWGQNVIVNTREWGYIDFSPQGMNEVFGGEKLTYEEYLDAQMAIGRDVRGWFFLCHHEVSLGFAGQIERIARKNICFKRIYVSGMYMDGECFDGKEDHVWMSIEKFEDYQVGDCLEFFAETYRYLKTSNGKQIDFGLRNPSEIKKVDSYKLPSDDDLLRQSVDQIICEACMFRDHCYGGMCIANEAWLDGMRKSMFDAVKGSK